MNLGGQNKWTKALWEPNAGVETNKMCVTLGDIHGRNDYHLILVDESHVPNRLKLYKGLSSIAESVLYDSPAGIVSFVCDPGQTESPCLAVACGSSLLIYRNMKPYYRYNIPQMDILQVERDIWNRFREGVLQADDLFNALKHLQSDYSLNRLSFQSQQFLTLPSEQHRPSFLEYILSVNKEKIELTNVQIACLSKIPRHTSQSSGVDVLIVGTELGSIYFVDSQAYTVLQHLSISVTPTKILALGTYDIEYRIIICTREHDVFILRKNAKGVISQNSFYVREYPFDVISCGSQLVFATRKRRLIFFSGKGKRQNSMQFDDEITDIEQFYYEPRQYNGVLVAIGCEVHLYVDQFCVDTLRMDFPIEWIKFGKMGREEGVLIIATQGGGLCVKIFRRVATFDDETSLNRKSKPVKSIEVPKKSKLFVEQSLRERENPQLLHQIYQRDWFMIKYHTAKTFAALESGKTDLIPTHESEPFQLTFDILGFGPNFKIIVRLICPVKLKPCRRWLCFVYNSTEYSFAYRIINIPLITPNKWFSFCNEVMCLNPEKQLQEEVKIVLARQNLIRPLWSVTFEMPVSEPSVS